MKIEFETKKLNKIIQNLSRNIKRCPVETLRNIQIFSKKDKIVFRSTDLDVDMTYAVNAPNISLEPILVNAEELSNLIKNYPGDNVSLEFSNEELIIEGEDISATIPLKKSTDYPEAINLDELQSEVIDFKVIKQAIEKVMNASAPTQDTKLSGVNFKTNDRTLSVAATDGFRLSVYKLFLEEEIEMNFTISKKCAQELVKFEVATPVVLSYQTKTHWIIFAGQRTIVVRKLDYEYPNYEKAIPTDNKHKIAINREDFIKKLLFVSSQSELVKLAIDNSVITIHSQDGRTTAKVPYKLVGEVQSIEFFFKPQYLLDGLKIFDTEDIVFVYKEDSKRPVMFESLVKTSYTDILYVTMSAQDNRK